MPNVAQVLKLEMKRIAAKELRASGLVGKLKTLNARVRTLQRRVKELEKRPVAVTAKPEAQEAEAPKKGRRFKATPAVLKRIRAKLGVTQVELAKLVGVSHSAVYQWEAGRIGPRARTTAKLQAAERMGRREARPSQARGSRQAGASFRPEAGNRRQKRRSASAVAIGACGGADGGRGESIPPRRRQQTQRRHKQRKTRERALSTDGARVNADRRGTQERKWRKALVAREARAQG